MTRSPSRTRRALISLRTTVILALGVLVALGVAALGVTSGLGPVETTMAAGAAFVGTITFLNAAIS